MGIACTEPALDPSAKSQSCTESRKIPRQELWSPQPSEGEVARRLGQKRVTKHVRASGGVVEGEAHIWPRWKPSSA